MEGTKENHRAPMGTGGKSVEKRLRSSYIIILTVLTFCIIGSLGALLKISADYKYAIENYGFSQGYIGQLGIEFNAMTTNLRSMILETEQSEIEKIKTTLDENKNDIDKYLKQVVDIANTDEEYTILDEIDVVLERYREIKTEVIELAESNLNDEAYDLLSSEGVTLASTIKQDINSLLALNINKCNETTKSANGLSVFLIIIVAALTLMAIIIGMKLAGNISRSICDPLNEVIAAADKLKSGQLDIEIAFQSEDELGVLADSFRAACSFMKKVIQDTGYLLNEMSQGNFCIRSEHRDSYIGEFKNILEAMALLRDRMNSVLLSINEASNQVSAGAGQMAESAQGLAEGATEQAGAVEELTATIENVTAMVETSAQAAEESYSRAQEYQRDAEVGNQTMGELTEAMQRINETAKQIGNIIAEIEDIASQTNLLSLNAAIEAARAGEAGRGFAVVADQISKLASDSARSAVNTKQLIENAIQEIDHGNQITSKTSQALGKVVTGMKFLGDNSRESSASAKDQAVSMKQIQEGIEQISSVVQNNSAAAEETSATSEELSAQAVTLSEEVNKFKLYRN